MSIDALEKNKNTEKMFQNLDLKDGNFDEQEKNNIGDLNKFLPKKEKGEKYTNEELNSAIESRFSAEINTIGNGADKQMIQDSMKNAELLLGSKRNPEEKLKAYCTYIESLKIIVGSVNGKQNLQDKDFKKNIEAANNELIKSKDFKKYKDSILEAQLKLKEKRFDEFGKGIQDALIRGNTEMEGSISSANKNDPTRNNCVFLEGIPEKKS